MKFKTRSAAIILAAAAVVFVSMGVAASAVSESHVAATGPKSEFGRVRQILQTNRVGSHNDNRTPESMDLAPYKAVMASGEHGPIVLPRHPEKSNL